MALSTPSTSSIVGALPAGGSRKGPLATISAALERAPFPGRGRTARHDRPLAITTENTEPRDLAFVLDDIGLRHVVDTAPPPRSGSETCAVLVAGAAALSSLFDMAGAHDIPSRASLLSAPDLHGQVRHVVGTAGRHAFDTALLDLHPFWLAAVAALLEHGAIACIDPHPGTIGGYPVRSVLKAARYLASGTPPFDRLLPCLDLISARSRVAMHGNPRPDAISAAANARPCQGSHAFMVQCALYMASLIIGAGILGLPTLTATVGLIPAVGMALLLGIAVTGVYVRIARSIHAAIRARVAAQYTAGMHVLQRSGIGHDALPELQRNLGTYLLDRKGAGIVDAACAWLGLGRAGSLALLTGLTAFVIPALTLYITIGGGALSTLAMFLLHNGVSAAVVAALPAGGLLLAWRASRQPRVAPGNAVLTTLLQMISSWLVAIAILMVAPTWEPLGMVLFAATIAGLVCRSGARSTSTTPRGHDRLEPIHQLGAIIAIINITLLFLTGMLALLVLRSHGLLAAPDLVATSIDTGDVVKTCGGLLFAYTGTGVFNLIRYPSLFDSKSRTGKTRLGTAVMLGTLLATAAYGGWMISMAFALPPTTLLEADDQRSYATVPLAQALAEHGPTGSIVFLCGYVVALLAVTSAGIGFSESLAEPLARLGGARHARRSGRCIDPGDLPDRWRIRRVQLGVLALTTGAALAIQGGGSGIAYRDILSVAGYAGGGLLLFVLPFFIPASGQGRATRRDIVLATIMALALATLNILELPSEFGRRPGGTVAGLLVIGITIGFLFSVAWLLVGRSSAQRARDIAIPWLSIRPRRNSIRRLHPDTREERSR